jgi:hypothetical protein
MTKLKQLSTGIFALALMLVSNVQTWAQSGNAAAPKTAVAAQAERNASGQMTGVTTASPQQTKVAANEAVNNYKYDASNPELSNARLTLLKAKAELATGREDKTLTTEQTASLNLKISKLEKQVQTLSPALTSKEIASSSPSKEMSASLKSKDISNSPQSLSAVPKEQRSTSNADAIIQSKKCTRAQFLSLTQVEQKQLLPHIQDITVTDLVNATSADIKGKNVDYMTVSDFKNADPEKQFYILSNPSSFYKIIE